MRDFYEKLDRATHSNFYGMQPMKALNLPQLQDRPSRGKRDNEWACANNTRQNTQLVPSKIHRLDC